MSKNSNAQTEKLLIVDEASLLFSPMFDLDDPEVAEMIKENQGRFGEQRVLEDPNEPSDRKD